MGSIMFLKTISALSGRGGKTQCTEGIIIERVMDTHVSLEMRIDPEFEISLEGHLRDHQTNRPLMGDFSPAGLR